MPYNDPDRQKDIARQKLIKAVQRGKIFRPSKCEDCGLPCVPDGHHNDYTKPLEVAWLCKTCHGETHGFYDGIYTRDAYSYANDYPNEFARPPLPCSPKTTTLTGVSAA